MDYLRNHPFGTWSCLTLTGAAAMIGAFWFGVQGSVKLFMLCAACSIFILGARDLFCQSNRQLERTERLRQRAAELGLDFQETAPFNVFGWGDSFELTKRAFAFESVIDKSALGKFAMRAIPKSRNVLLRSSAEARLALFDFEFSDNEVIYHQAVAAIQSPCLDHPYFALFPANAWDKFSAGFRTEPTVYGNHRSITEATVSATDVAAIAESLDANATLEVSEGYLLLYRRDRRPLRPADIETKLSEVMSVYAAVSQIPASV